MIHVLIRLLLSSTLNILCNDDNDFCHYSIGFLPLGIVVAGDSVAWSDAISISR